MTLEIRRARPDELEACAALFDRVVRATFTWEAHGDRAAEFLAAAAEEEVYVAIEADRILGIASFYRPAHFLHSLFVEDRGRGVGSALLAHVETVATSPVSLKVDVLNTQAQRFYERKGLKVIERGRRDDGGAWLRMKR